MVPPDSCLLMRSSDWDNQTSTVNIRREFVFNSQVIEFAIKVWSTLNFYLPQLYHQAGWSRRWDLNPHGVTRGILSPLRLPIPPLRDVSQSFLSVNIFSLVLPNAFSLSLTVIMVSFNLLQFIYYTIIRKPMGVEPTTSAPYADALPHFYATA